MMTALRKNLLLVLVSAMAVTAVVRPVAAQMACPGSDQCADDYVPGIMAYCGQGGSDCCDCQTIRDYLADRMNVHRRGGGGERSFLFDIYWNDVIRPKVEAMLNKIISTSLKKTTAIGGFVDAQNNVRAQTALQAGQAEAARDYAVSEQLCRFGTLGQNLAADEQNARQAQLAIATQEMQRNLGARQSIAQAGSATDVASRMSEFIMEYCDPKSAGSGLGLMCPQGGTKRRFTAVPKDQRFDRDIDYVRTLDHVSTVDFNMRSENNEPGDQDILALGHNLYGNRQISGRSTTNDMKNDAGQKLYFKIRSVATSRAVALNSYAAIAGMKTRGSGGTQRFMRALMLELGEDARLADEALGEAPSYFAQMGFLTKKLYQSPNFIIDLMEGKTNVDRQSTAMEGVELMQDRDLYQSMKRSEMLLAIMVQIEARKMLREKVEDINTLPAKVYK